MGNMIGAGLMDAFDRALSPEALVTGGLSLARTTHKAMRNAKNAPDLPPAPQAPPAVQAPKQASRGSTGGGAGGGAGLGTVPQTLLTGPSGVDPSTLNLGRNTLLGQ